MWRTSKKKKKRKEQALKVSFKMTADIFFSKVAWALKKISLSKLTIKIVVDKETNYIISYSFVCMCLSVFLCVRVGQRWTFQTPWWAARTVVDSLAWRKGNHHFTSVSEINITFPPRFFVIFGQISTEKGQTWFDLVHWKMSMALNSMPFHISLEPATVNFLSLNRQL